MTATRHATREADMTTIAERRAVAAMNRPIVIDDRRFATRYQAIDQLLADGYRPDEETRRLYGPDGRSFLAAEDITVTAFRYALFKASR